MAQQTVPLKLNDKVIGTAIVMWDDSGARVISTSINDPAAKKFLTEATCLGGFSVGYMTPEEK